MIIAQHTMDSLIRCLGQRPSGDAADLDELEADSEIDAHCLKTSASSTFQLPKSKPAVGNSLTERHGDSAIGSRCFDITSRLSCPSRTGSWTRRSSQAKPLDVDQVCSDPVDAIGRRSVCTAASCVPSILQIRHGPLRSQTPVRSDHQHARADCQFAEVRVRNCGQAYRLRCDCTTGDRPAAIAPTHLPSLAPCEPFWSSMAASFRQRLRPLIIH